MNRGRKVVVWSRIFKWGTLLILVIAAASTVVALSRLPTFPKRLASLPTQAPVIALTVEPTSTSTTAPTLAPPITPTRAGVIVRPQTATPAQVAVAQGQIITPEAPPMPATPAPVTSTPAGVLLVPAETLITGTVLITAEVTVTAEAATVQEGVLVPLQVATTSLLPAIPTLTPASTPAPTPTAVPGVQPPAIITVTTTTKGGFPVALALPAAEPAVTVVSPALITVPATPTVTVVTTTITAITTTILITTATESTGTLVATVTPIPVILAPGTVLPYARIATTLHAGPDMTSAVVGQVAQGQVLEIIAWHTTGEWFLLADGSWIQAAAVENAPQPLPLVIPTPTFTPSLTPTVTPTFTPTPPAPGSPTPTPTPTSLDVAICDCTSDQFDCLGSSFLNRSAAQSCFEYCFRVTGLDIHNLDPNGNGMACENLP